MLYERVQTEHTLLADELQSIKEQLSFLPDGKLLCASNGEYTKWYHSDGHTHSYIPKKNLALAQTLAYKKYLLLRQEFLEKELPALSYYLHHHDSKAKQRYLSLLTDPDFAPLLSPNIHPISDELNKWMNSPFESNPLHPEGLIHTGPCGLLVRSKSEALIATLLSTHNIPFRYEAPLIINDATYYPDFTIRHPKTGAYFYWEHFGMMDDSSYCQKSFSKLNHYSQNGIIPSIQLITTYETKLRPLNTDIINSLIRQYFL